MIVARLTSRFSARIEVWGDLDTAGARSLRYVVHDLLRPGMELVVDLARTASIKPAGLSALEDVRRHLHASGGGTKVVGLLSSLALNAKPGPINEKEN